MPKQCSLNRLIEEQDTTVELCEFCDDVCKMTLGDITDETRTEILENAVIPNP